MFKNYLKIVLNNARNKKVYSSVNILGITIGLSCCFIIAAFIKHEFSFDKFHKKNSRIYRILQGTEFSKTGKSAGLFGYIAKRVSNKYPEVIATDILTTFGAPTLRYKEKLFYENKIRFTDENFLKIFDYELLKGDREYVLKEKNSIVITESMAKKYFGNTDPIGKIIQYECKSKIVENVVDLIVTGVLKNIPTNSHLVFDGLATFSSLKEIGNPWAYQGYTYVLVPPEHAIEDLEQKMNRDNHYLMPSLKNAKLYLQTLNNIYLENDHQRDNTIERSRSATYIYLLTSLAIIILIMVCLNYLNLTASQYFTQTREIGVHKILGATKENLMFRYIIESSFFCFIGFILSLVTIRFCMPFFNNIVNSELEYHHIYNLKNMISYIFITICICVLVGAVPSISLGRREPILMISNVINIDSKRYHFRHGFVAFQFIIAICCVACIIIIFQQLHLIKNGSVGYDKQNILYIELKNTDLTNKSSLLLNEIMSCSHVLEGCVSNSTPLALNSYFTADNIKVNSARVGYNYFRLFNHNLVDGRFFNKDVVSDKNAIIVNETAIKTFNLENKLNQEISNRIILGIESFKLIGIIEDFQIGSFHNQMNPTIFKLAANNDNIIVGNRVVIKYNPIGIEEVISHIKKIWEKHFPQYPLQYHYLDIEYNNRYINDYKFSKAVQVFVVLSLLISCLGLFGLIGHTVERRTKEIGIRKVVGASVPSILALLVKDFIKWILLANLIAWPIGYYGMNKWLQNFAYRIDLTIWPFLLAGLIALVIAMLTVSWQVVRAARANPVESLRYE